MAEEDDIVVLHSASGKETRFRRIASVPLGESRYAVLAPEVPFPGMQEGQALVFEVTEKNGEMASMNIVTDQGLVNEVFDAYTAIMLRKTEEQALKKE